MGMIDVDIRCIIIIYVIKLPAIFIPEVFRTKKSLKRKISIVVTSFKQNKRD